MRILVAGELNVDLVLQNYSDFPALGREVLVNDVALTLGSASAICASALAKLEEEVSFIGKTGCDAWGDLCVEWLSNAGVDCSFILKDPALKTGITVSISSACDRALVTYLGSSAALRATDIRNEQLNRFDHLHVSSYFLQRGLRPGLKGLMTRAHEHGLTSSLDPGFDPEQIWGEDLIDTLSEVDVFLPNEVELAALSHEPDPVRALRVLDNERTLIVVKLGASGCMAIQDGAIVSVPAFPVNPVETTGAGDTFNAGFLHAWLGLSQRTRGSSLEGALRFAAACGALSTLAPGGTGAQPTDSEVREFIESRSGVQSESRAGAAL